MLNESAIQKPTKFQGPHCRRAFSTGLRSWFVSCSENWAGQCWSNSRIKMNRYRAGVEEKIVPGAECWSSPARPQQRACQPSVPGANRLPWRNSLSLSHFLSLTSRLSFGLSNNGMMVAKGSGVGPRSSDGHVELSATPFGMEAYTPEFITRTGMYFSRGAARLYLDLKIKCPGTPTWEDVSMT